MNPRKASLILVVMTLISCGGTRKVLLPPPEIDNGYVSHEFELEKKLYRVTPAGETFLKVFPIIESPEDLLAYRDYKIAEAGEIFEMTEEQREELPYFSAVITFKEPLSTSEINDILMSYNPSFKEKLKGLIPKGNYLVKSDFVTGRDELAIFKARFRSTMGGGELPFDVLSNPQEMEGLQTMIKDKERELNNIDDYQFVKGITAIYGALHRDKLGEMQGDPRVFLVDVGPRELYEEVLDHVVWKDIYNKVEAFYEH